MKHRVMSMSKGPEAENSCSAVGTARDPAVVWEDRETGREEGSSYAILRSLDYPVTLRKPMRSLGTEEKMIRVYMTTGEQGLVELTATVQMGDEGLAYRTKDKEAHNLNKE